MTGNASKSDKKKQMKTSMALIGILGVAATAGVFWLAYMHRDQIASGGAAAAATLGPILSRVVPAIMIGLLSMIIGPEGAVLGVPIGAIFGPELLSAIAFYAFTGGQKSGGGA